VDFDKIWG